MAHITDTLKEQFKDFLTEESLAEIENVFNEAVEQKASLAVEAALVKQDDDHAGKVQTLLEAIDDDHTKKLDRIVEAVTQSHTAKLRTVVEKYEQALQGDASLYKESLISNISNYLDLYIEKTYPQDMLEEAVKNKKFEQLVTEMRNVLGVDMALAKESIKDAILDGKTQISKTTSKLEEANKENVNLKQELGNAKRKITLENLTKDLPEIKKNYVQKVLGNKDVEFINENFQYTLDLFDKDTETQLETLTEEAKGDVQGTVDPVIEEQVTTEQEEDDDSPVWGGYMSELGKY